MSSYLATRKTVTPSIFAILIVAAFLLGGFAVTPAGALGVDQDDTIFATVDGVPFTGSANMAVGGEPTVVDLSIRLPANTASPKVVVERTLAGATTPTTTEATLTPARTVSSGDTGDIWWKARVLLGTSDPAQVGKYVAMDGTKANTIKVFYPGTSSPTHSLPGDKAIVWTKSHTATLATISSTAITTLSDNHVSTFFAQTTTTGALGTGTIQFHIQDKDITPPADAAFTNNKAACPTGFPSYQFLLRDQDGNQYAVPASCVESIKRGSGIAYLVRATGVDYTAASIAPGETFTVSLLDPKGDGGVARLVSTSALLKQATDYGFKLFRNDYRSEVTAVSGSDTTYVLRVRDIDSNTNKGTADKLKVAAQMRAGTNIIGSTNLELTETGADTAEFQTTFQFARNPITGQVAVPHPVVSGQTYTLVFVADDTRGANAVKPSNQLVSDPYTWTPSSDSNVRVLDQNSQLIASTPPGSGAELVKFGESAADFPQGTLSGSYIEVRVEDQDATGSTLRAIVRGSRADPGTCNAAILPTTGALPADTPSCGYLELARTSSGSSTYVGYVGLYTPTSYTEPILGAEKTSHPGKARILVTPESVVTVEVLDQRTGTGSENRAVKTDFIWKQAYNGQITVDKDNYYRAESATVRILDPDQAGESSLSAIAKSTPTGSQLSLTLNPVSGQSGLFEATLKLSGSGSLATADGDTVTIEYRDPQDADGRDRRGSGQDPFTREFQVWTEGSGFPVFAKKNHLDFEEGTITVVDANHDPAASVPAVEIGATYSGIADTAYLTATSADNTYEAKIRPDEWLITEPVTPQMVTNSAIGGDGNEGSCYWQLPLSHVPSHFATVVAKRTNNNDLVWKHSTTPSTTNEVFRYDAPRSRLIIDEVDRAPANLCAQQSVQRTDVVGWTFHVTYSPAPFVTEHLINNDKDEDEVTLQLQSPYFTNQNGLSKELLPKTDWTRSVPPQTSAAAGSWYIPFDLDRTYTNAGERQCVVTIDGTAGSCSINATSMVATLKASGGAKIRAGAVIVVNYYQNHVASTSLGTSETTKTLTHGPVALGSIQTADRKFRFDPAPGAQPNDVNTIKAIAQDSTPTIQRSDLHDANKAAPTGAQTLFYHTQVFRDNRVPYNERFADSEGRITATYNDPSGAVGNPSSATTTASFSVNKPADITPKTPEGIRTNHIFGGDQGAFLEVTDPTANADNTAIDTITVNAAARVVKYDGFGAVLEQEALTLTETGPGTGIFTARLRFLPTSPAGDGALAVAENDMVQVDFDYQARNSKATAWYYRSEGATMTIGSETVLGEGATTSVELRDREVGERVADFRFTGMPASNSGTTLKLFLPPAFVPAIVDSEAVYVCKQDTTDCEPWKRIPSLTAATQDSKQYMFNPETGVLEINLDPTGSVAAARVPTGDDVRIDLRVRRASDADVRVATFDALGRFQADASSGGALGIRETGASSGTFREDVTFRRGTSTTPYGLETSTNTITLLDGDKVEFRAIDTNFFRLGDRKNYAGTNPSVGSPGCGANTENPLSLERCPMGVNHLVQAVKSTTWTETTNAALTVRSETFAASTANKDVYGAQPITIRVVDGDQNVDPKKADTVQVTISSGGSTHTQTLTETGANDGIFEAVVVLRDVLAPAQGTNYDVVYTDTTSATGTSATRRMLTDTIPGTSTKVSSAKWFSAERGTLSLSDDLLSKSSTVQVRVRDSDRNADRFQRDEIKAFSAGSSLRVYPTTAHEGLLPGGTATVGDELVLRETGVDTGIFEGLLDVSTLNLAALGEETFLRFEYSDPKTHNGVPGKRVEVVKIVSDDTGLPTVPSKTLTSRTQLVTVTVDDDDLSGKSRVEVFYKDFGKDCTSSGSTQNCKSLTLGTDGQVTFGIQTTDTDDIPDVPVENDKPFYLVYTDEKAFSATDPSPRILVQRMVLQSIDSALTTEVAVSPATPDGNSGCSTGAGTTCFGWYKSPVTVQLAVPEDKQQILQKFEYKFGQDGTVQSCAVGCSFTVSTEGENKVFVRSVTIGGFEEDWQELTVKVDGTAPTAVVSGVTATLRPGGAVELTWTSTVDKDNSKEFGSYVVFRDGLSDDPVSPATLTEEKYTDTPGDEETHTWYVVIADAAGNMDTTDLPDTVKVSAKPDKTAPKLDTANISPKELHEEKGETTVTISATVATDTLADTNKVIVRATDPFGKASSDFELARQGTSAVWSGSFSGFNVSGIWTITVAAVDIAGNEGQISENVRYFGVDNAPPIVEVPTTVTKGDPLKVTVKDNDAGLATVTYRIDGAAAVSPSVTGKPLNHTFDIPTASLSIGEHTLVIDVADAYSTPNTKTYTFTFEVTGTDGGTTPPPTTKPVIEQATSLVESGGSFRFTVRGSGLTALTVAYDGGAAANVLASWTGATVAVSTSIGSLAAGEHTATVVATNVGGTTTSTFTFYVLDAGVPLPPESVVVTKNKDGLPKIDWTASPSSNVGGYLVHRASSPSVVIAVLGADVTSFVDETAKSGKSYTYAVTAYGSNGEGRLEKGGSSEDLAWFGGVTASSFQVDAGEPGLLAYWWIALILLAVIGAVAMAYVYRERLFGRREDEEAYEAEYPDEAGSPFATEHHQMRCPNCTHEFSVSGQKPIITTCPNCGKKGILR